MLKRTGFKNKQRKPLKRSAMKRVSKSSKKVTKKKVVTTTSLKKKRKIKTPIQKIKEKLWDECKRLIRLKYQNTDGTWDCFTCHKNINVLSDAHTAHFIPSSTCGALLRYDLRNLRVCCYNCNINLGGNGAVFYQQLVLIEGQKYVDDIFADKNKSIKADLQFYEQKLNEYRNMG